MSLLRDVWTYISKPYFYESEEKLSVKVLPILGKLWVIKFGLVIFVYFLTQFLFKLTDTHRPDRTAKFLENIDLFDAFLIILIVPLLEELIFRSWLRKRWGVKYIFPFVLGLTILILAHFFGFNLPPYTIAIWMFVLVCYFYLISSWLSSEDSTRFADFIFPYVFWISTLSFALIHLTNYKAEHIGLLAILIVLPQLISGTIYAYILKRFGFWASFLAHGFWNGSLTLLLFLIRGVS